MGELVFGQSFRCLENIHYHPWIEFIFSSIKFGAVIVAMTYVGLGELVQIIVKLSANAVSRVQSYTEEMVRARLAMDQGRDDLFEGLVKRTEEWVCEYFPFYQVDPMTLNSNLIMNLYRTCHLRNCLHPHSFLRWRAPKLRQLHCRALR